MLKLEICALLGYLITLKDKCIENEIFISL